MAQVYDYGDETQWEEMSIEGLDWLPNRIHGNHLAGGGFNRVVVIHSPLQSKSRKENRNENEKDVECTHPLIIDKVPDSMVSIPRNGSYSSMTTDHEFLYGMQLLKNCLHEFGDTCVDAEQQQHSQSASLYRRVFNVR